MAARLVAAGRALAPVIYRNGAPETIELYAEYDCWLSHGQRREPLVVPRSATARNGESQDAVASNPG